MTSFVYTLKDIKLAPPQEQLAEAAMQNDVNWIRRLVEEEGVSVNHTNAFLQSALHVASLWGNVEAVTELLNHKAKVNAQNSNGYTPLHCTVHMQGIQGRFKTRSKNRRVLCMDLLMEAGADLSIMDYSGKTASEYRTVAKLVTVEPSCYEEIYMSETPFQYALNLLLKEDGNDVLNQEGGTNLVGILQTLLEAGANVNAILTNPLKLENPTLTPLYRVCTALQTAYKNKEEPAIPLLQGTCELLVKHQAHVSPGLEQLLHIACRKNELQLANFLIRVVHIDPNVQGRQGMTPLQFAARSGKTEMVSYMLSLPNINPSIQDDHGQTALDAARINDKQDVAALLEDFYKT